MEKRIVTPEEAGQRLNKFLEKQLKEAPKSFIYKMLRKKNIVLNGKKADGSEKTCAGDEVTFWLSDETFEKFSGQTKDFVVTTNYPDVIYEDEHIILMNKPAGLLSQKAEEDDISINEEMISYLLYKEQLTKEQLKTFRPSVTNRLDRNTTGLIGGGKDMAGLQFMSHMFKQRIVHKYYLTIVTGIVNEAKVIKGFLYKDDATNKVTITSEKTEHSEPIETAYEPLAYGDNLTLLKIQLMTGRTHQIRAHLASIGHSVIGDYKYGSKKVNDYFRSAYHLKHQLLHSWQLVFPQEKDIEEDTFKYLANKTFTAPLPELFDKIKSKEITEEK